MKMTLSINGEFTELVFCLKHEEWHYLDDEGNCCFNELEKELQSHDY